MLRIFFKLLVRNFIKHKYLNMFNILGITMGLICFSLVLLYVDHEFSFDNFHYDPNNTYRIEGKTNSDFWLSNIDAEYGKELNSGAYSQVKNVLRIAPMGNLFFNYGDKRFSENNIYRVEPGSEFFEMFRFNFIEGSEKNVLKDPYSIVMTRSTARKYFGDEPALGKIINYDSLLLTVKGVVEDLPTNTHLNFDLIYAQPGNGQHYHAFTYLRLTKNSDSKRAEELILNMRDDLDEFHKLTTVKLIGVKDIYFESEAAFGNSGAGDRTQLTGFMIAGFLILLIAILNYINLSLAIYSGKRFEVGIRKILGESKLQFNIIMFLESLLISLASVFLAVFGIELTLPYFSDFLSLSLENKFLSSPYYWLSGVAFVLAVNLIITVYPSLMLGKANVSRLVKSKETINGKQGLGFLNILIFIQFILFFTLGISAWFVNRQIHYIDNKDLGFSTHGVIKIRNAFFLNGVENYNLLKERLLTYSEIESVTHGAMMGDDMTPLAYKPEGQDQIYENLLSFGVGEDYFDVMNIKIVAGDFRRVMETAQSGQVVSLVNQSFIDQYNWRENPVGKTLILRPGTENELHRTISAVFRDFHFFSLKEKIGPHIISMRKEPTNININVLVKTNPANLKRAYEIIETEWYAFAPDRPVEYVLMDDEIRSFYQQERRVGNITLLFSVLALLLSFGGLIIFVTYITKLRSKEIALRQVLGASMMQIILVLNKKTFWIIMLAALFGSTFSYLLINQWLTNFANTITLHPIAFIAATIAGYGIAFMIIVGQSYKSAISNPLATLGQE